MNDFLKSFLESQGYLPDEAKHYIQSNEHLLELYNMWLRKEITDLQAEHNDARHGTRPDDVYERILDIIK